MRWIELGFDNDAPWMARYAFSRLLNGCCFRDCFGDCFRG